MDKAKEKEYDIILLDVMLPKQDGFAVCQQIREFSSRAHHYADRPGQRIWIRSWDWNTAPTTT